MDIQRIILILGMAVTSYMLVLAWNQDYHQNTSNGALEVTDAAPVVPDYDVPLGTIPEEVVDELPDIEPQADVQK